ncbi:MAG: hypothetical protein WKF79_01015 [Nocardioides sp.]
MSSQSEHLPSAGEHTSRDQVSPGIYWQPHAWDQARSGYVADLDADPDPAPSLIAWLNRAIGVHSHRTPLQRAELAGAGDIPRDDAGEGVGFKRTLLLDVA